MNDQTERDPNLFEMKFRAQVQKSESSKTLDSKGDSLVLAEKLTLRVDSRDMDDVLRRLIPIADLQRHNIQSVDDWVESVGERTDNQVKFSDAYKDHQVKARGSGRIIFALPDCQLTSFAMNFKDVILTFTILSKSHDPEAVAKIAEHIDAHLVFEFKRGDHWSSQETIPTGDQEPEGDGHTQTSALTAEEQAAVEKAKNEANEKNTAKARKRKPRSKSK